MAVVFIVRGFGEDLLYITYIKTHSVFVENPLNKTCIKMYGREMFDGVTNVVWWRGELRGINLGLKKR